jgi:hypothetical protein
VGRYRMILYPDEVEPPNHLTGDQTGNHSPIQVVGTFPFLFSFRSHTAMGRRWSNGCQIFHG